MHQESTTERHQVAGQGPQPVHWNENKDGGPGTGSCTSYCGYLGKKSIHRKLDEHRNLYLQIFLGRATLHPHGSV